MRMMAASALFTLAIALPFASPVAAETCSLAVVHCKQKAVRQSDRDEKCAAAGAQCMQSGTFIGPYTGEVRHGFTKK
jgi:hypothetical protein